MIIDREVVGLVEENREADLLMADFEEAVNHAVVVSRLAEMISKEAGMDEAFVYEISLAGMLHDIGKMRLGRYIYGRRSDTLKVEEMAFIRMHAGFSFDILKKLDYNDNILSSIHHHHENYDGSGYPDNLKGEEIPVGARVLRVCDVFSALTADRPYRPAFPVETAIEIMIEEVKNYDMKFFLALQRVVHSSEFEDLKFFIQEANQEMRSKRNIYLEEKK